MNIFKLIQRGYITAVHGCISTGKEANVYRASSKRGDVAVKVYRTSVMTFKDRDRYISSEFRYRRGYCRKNPRKKIKVWAEKEYRNLKRIDKVDIACPEPLAQLENVVLMKFLGEKELEFDQFIYNINDIFDFVRKPSPLLKDVKLSAMEWDYHYQEICMTLRSLFNKCKLVHADLSEYNIIFHNMQLFVIDVAQAVEHDDSYALEFLRRDCKQMNKFFSKRGVTVLTVKELFQFVTDPIVKEDEAYFKFLELLEFRQKQNSLSDKDVAKEAVDEEVFNLVHIEQKLSEVLTFEKDYELVQAGEQLDVFYPVVTGMKDDLTGAKVSENSSSDLSDEWVVVGREEAAASKKASSATESFGKGPSVSLNLRQRDESPNTKKARKKLVKFEQRQKRQVKLRKYCKKRKQTLSKLAKRK
ncbi:RIO1 family protein [Trichinella nativa]|uniref:Serine/threonine-protein kinase RIO1 n=1 Tax=Trichinella nativa TaxID=6335 RepID=A0A1Y3EVA3_9BILA|nr:RIO1 family protein [Trichinella nativa]